MCPRGPSVEGNDKVGSLNTGNRDVVSDVGSDDVNIKGSVPFHSAGCRKECWNIPQGAEGIPIFHGI